MTIESLLDMDVAKLEAMSDAELAVLVQGLDRPEPMSVALAPKEKKLTKAQQKEAEEAELLKEYGELNL